MSFHEIEIKVKCTACSTEFFITCDDFKKIILDTKKQLPCPNSACK